MWPIFYKPYSIGSTVSYSLNSSVEAAGESDQSIGLASTLYNNSMRTQMLLLDYKQFKAARIVQTTFRCWRVRNLMKNREKAAIVIQRNWRIYIAKRQLEIVAQEKAQTTILCLFESSSVKIQALFRGWWSRKHVNNLIHLKSLQLTAVQDILYCITRKLHNMKRTERLPGVLSFCDRDCLSKVDKLVLSLSYRVYNPFVARKCIASKALLQRIKEEFKNSLMYTWAPYTGFDCDSLPNWNIPVKAYDHIEQDFADSFLDAKRTIEDNKIKISQKDTKPSKVMSVKQKEFCEQMMWKIKKWSVFQDGNLNLSDSLMDVGVSEFLDIIKGHLETFNYLENCHCKSDLKSCPSS